MKNYGKFPVLGIGIHAVDYEYVVSEVVRCGKEGSVLSVSALAVHGVMSGFLDRHHTCRLNSLDMVVPDGQPVRWALKWLHKVHLEDRVYGPNLALYVAEAFAEQGLGIYLYGSHQEVLDLFGANLKKKFPSLIISGSCPSRFEQVSLETQKKIASDIEASGAKAVFVGLGCPRQEVWAFENSAHLKMPILAVGAAFDFHANLLPQAPTLLQRLGLEWFYRLIKEPGRLWMRYTILNPLYLILAFLERVKLARFSLNKADGSQPYLGYS